MLLDLTISLSQPFFGGACDLGSAAPHLPLRIKQFAVVPRLPCHPQPLFLPSIFLPKSFAPMSLFISAHQR